MNSLIKIYGENKDILRAQEQRYQSIIETFEANFGKQSLLYFSTPGRVEIGGNHTDHNHGKVLAASINLDSIAVAAPCKESIVTICSEGYSQPFVIELNDLNNKQNEIGKTSALLRGIAARLKETGYKIGGFNACLSSQVLPGSGLSSSASIELLLVSIFNHLFNNAKIDLLTIAKVGQYAENVYFGKPCGLMDQLACAYGGIVSIDFKNQNNPFVEPVEFDFEKEKNSLLIVDTGGNHADLTEEYASIPSEMKAAAKVAGAEYLGDADEATFYSLIPQIRRKYGDRAVLRGLHFFEENSRVGKQVNALNKSDFKAFLKIVSDSGNSSLRLLQNIFSTKNVQQQSVSLALAMTEKFLNDIEGGACRVHGGGFAGTILVFMPKKKLTEYIKIIEPVFGSDCTQTLTIRQHGSVCLDML